MGSTSFKEVEQLSREQALVLDFSASYCAPCEQLDVVLQGLEHDYGSRVRVLKVDIGECSELAQHFGVRSVPTLLGIVAGEVRAQQAASRAPTGCESYLRSSQWHR
ncbi:MAG: thioredoxin family protein [Myxococcales bacterium]|nr:thioredoxin family protein [Myxococcales bacterium]